MDNQSFDDLCGLLNTPIFSTSNYGISLDLERQSLGNRYWPQHGNNFWVYIWVYGEKHSSRGYTNHDQAITGRHPACPIGITLSLLTWGCFFGSSFETFEKFIFVTKSAKSAVPASVFGLPQAKKHLQKRATPPLELVFFEDDFASFPKASIHGRGYKAHGCRGFPYFFSMGRPHSWGKKFI